MLHRELGCSFWVTSLFFLRHPGQNNQFLCLSGCKTMVIQKCYHFMRASLVAQMVSNLPATWETRVGSLGWEDPLEKEMTTHSSTLVWKIPWTEKPGRLQSMGSQRVGHD